jgi:hypothetical protein
VALACFVAARLASDCTADSHDLPEMGRAARSAGARGWLGTLALPATVRGPLLRCVESTAEGPPREIADELAQLAAAGAAYLDPGSRIELESLVAVLRK